MNILLAESAGFCFGVQNAVELLENECEKIKDQNGTSLYTWGPIIHNETVTGAFARRGVRVLSDAGDLSGNGRETVVIRAHGVPPLVYEELAKKNVTVKDGTCPFVSRIHRIVQKEHQKGRRVVIAGDEAHPEVQGILGWCENDAAVVCEKEEFILLAASSERPLSMVSQTTFPLEKFKEFVEIIGKKGYDINVFDTVCHATRARQEEAARMASRADAMLVIGDKSSSNTRKLVEICKAQCRYTYHVQTAAELDTTLFTGIHLLGITAGASTPTNIIEEVIATCQKTT